VLQASDTRLGSVLVLALPLLIAVSACGEGTAEEARTTGEAGIAPPRVEAPTASATNQPVSGRDAQTIDVSELGHVFGEPGAPLTVFEFSDYGCGYCRQFHDQTWPSLREEFVESGKIRWRTIQFNVGMFPNAQDAALAGECAAEQGHFAGMRELLFRDQRVWKGTRDAGPVFGALAQEAGLDMERFGSCMSERRVEEPILLANTVARQAGVRGTPTFFIDGYPVSGAAPLDAFRTFFNRILDEKASAPSGP
jgi:protein-disulfide isomerase